MPPQGSECTCQEFDQIAVLVKEETTYSDDSLPANGDAVLFTGTPSVTTIAEKVERDVAKPYWGNDKHQHTAKFVNITGEVEVAGPGTPGDLPGAAALLRACGLAETVTASTDVQYDPASEGLKSVSTYFHMDKDLWKVVGMRGTTSLNMQAGQFAKWNFNMTGLFTKPEAASLPTGLTYAGAEPRVLNFENTPTADFFGLAVDVNSLTLDFNNTVSQMDKPGCYAVQIRDRAPGGTIVICAPEIGTLDIMNLADTYQTGAITVQHGVAAGEIMEVSMPVVQLDLAGISYTDIGNNEKGISIPYMVLPTSGDDEFTITYR